VAADLDARILAAWMSSFIILGCGSPVSVGQPVRGIAASGPSGTNAREPLNDAVPRIHEPHELDFLPVPLEPISVAYPARSRRLGLEGDVDCRVVVRPDGRVGSLRVASATSPEFESAALEALRLTRFRPAVLRGRPVAAYYEVRVRFRLD
jgi:TonB family protein